VALSTAQLLHAFSTRSEGISLFDRERAAPNRYLPMAVGGGIGLTVLTQLLPVTRRWLGSGAMPLLDWTVAGVGAVMPLLANEMIKKVTRRPAYETSLAPKIVDTRGE
jgi:hypothetical protein